MSLLMHSLGSEVEQACCDLHIPPALNRNHNLNLTLNPFRREIKIAIKSKILRVGEA